MSLYQTESLLTYFTLVGVSPSNFLLRGGCSIRLTFAVFNRSAVVEGCLDMEAPQNLDLPPDPRPVVHFDLDSSNGQKQLLQLMCEMQLIRHSSIHRQETDRTSLYPTHPQGSSIFEIRLPGAGGCSLQNTDSI